MTLPLRRLLLLLILLAALACPGALQAEVLERYRAELRGELDEPLRDTMLQSLDSFTLLESPPRTRSLLALRMKGDADTIRKILSSQGYFQGKVETNLQDDGEGTPLALFTITPGPRFRFGEIVVERAPDADPQTPLLSNQELGLVSGEPYTAKAVLDAQEHLLRHLGEQGYPFPAMAERKVTARHATQTVDLRFVLQSGPKAVFGATEITGLEHVDTIFVQQRLPWQEGQTFDQRLVEQARAGLIQTGLFSLAVFEKDPVAEDGSLPLRLELSERLPRTFRAGVRYRTDNGPGGKLEWEHRTLMGQGEHLQAALDADLVTQQLNLSFRKPSFTHENLSLLLEQKLLRERSEAYDGESSVSTAGLEYRLAPRMTVGAGLGYRLSQVNDNAKKDTYGLFSVPINLRYDSRNDLLNPIKGQRVILSATPYMDTLGNASNFLQGTASATHYFNLVGEDTLIFAVRGLVGGTWGADLVDVPKDLRLYAGGGTSIRGFAYRMAGDLDSSGDPIGGRSVFEASGELRWRFLGDFGLVAFADAGRAFDSELPDFGQELFVGAGLGLRYYSFVGPIGVDLAVPLNRRAGHDDRYQIYVSLGQSF